MQNRWMLLSLLVVACTDSSAVSDRLLTGSNVVVGAGSAHAELTVDRGGAITSLAIVMSDSALVNLPTSMTEFLLPLPAEAPSLVIDHVSLMWNPRGHAPAGVYNVPHFDAHYYLITQAKQAAISSADPEFATKGARKPASEFIPANYVADPLTIPNMGTHWYDPSAPERNALAPFTHTFIYGFYDAEMAFVEPMFAVSYLESHPSMTTSIALPARYQKPGRYPTLYTIRYDAPRKEYRVELAGFATRN